MSRLFCLVFVVGSLLFVGTTSAQYTAAPGKALPTQAATQQPGNQRVAQVPANQRAANVTANQPVGNQLPFNQRALVSPAQPAKPFGQPDWFPLPPDHEKYLMEILNYWEFQAAKVERYRSKFRRWEYDPIKLPHDPEIAATRSEGVIQYAAPDKGLFKVETVSEVAMQNQVIFDKQTNTERQISRPVIEGNKPKYQEQSAELKVFNEHWICDGKSIFEVNGREKKIIERRLPPEMQGKQITQGPLPFLFGAKAQTMLQQYWIRVTLPPPKPGEFMLEAIPKGQAQAADFREIRIVIDEQEFLPKALLLYHRGGGRSNYEFYDREKNWNILPEKLNPFHQQFFKPQAPAGWKYVFEPFEQQPPAGPAAAPPGIGANGIPPRQAIRQLTTPTKR